jgi:hypothetical protein
VGSSEQFSNAGRTKSKRLSHKKYSCKRSNTKNDRSEGHIYIRASFAPDGLLARRVSCVINELRVEEIERWNKEFTERVGWSKRRKLVVATRFGATEVAWPVSVTCGLGDYQSTL